MGFEPLKWLFSMVGRCSKLFAPGFCDQLHSSSFNSRRWRFHKFWAEISIHFTLFCAARHEFYMITYKASVSIPDLHAKCWTGFLPRTPSSPGLRLSILFPTDPALIPCTSDTEISAGSWYSSTRQVGLKGFSGQPRRYSQFPVCILRYWENCKACLGDDSKAFDAAASTNPTREP
jgi:hypothetical protein